MALDGIVETFALDGEGAGVVVEFSVHQQDRRFDLIRETERRHVVVHFRSLPVGAFLRLEAEWREGSVVGSAPRDACAEQARMREEVGRHECAVTVATHSNTGAVTDPFFCEMADGGVCIQVELRDELVVGFLVALAHDGHFCVVEYRISLRGPVDR